jgi:hypothetical protein
MTGSTLFFGAEKDPLFFTFVADLSTWMVRGMLSKGPEFLP